jgi:electron transfer flavoprotein alpha/beta subunit
LPASGVIVRIVVLVKPVPDTTGQDRLDPDLRVDRTSVPVVANANDEYALEAALKLVEAAGEGEVTLLAIAPAAAPETLRKALAMGAQRGVLICDPKIWASWPFIYLLALAGLQSVDHDVHEASALDGASWWPKLR